MGPAHWPRSHVRDGYRLHTKVQKDPSAAEVLDLLHDFARIEFLRSTTLSPSSVDPEIRHSHVPGALDQIPEPMVIAVLRAGRGGHADDHRPFAQATQLLKEEDAGRRSA